jgi:hypothetical protein
VLYRDHDGDRPALVASILKDGTLCLSILSGGGQWFVHDRVARDTQKADGGILIQGMWRFEP